MVSIFIPVVADPSADFDEIVRDATNLATRCRTTEP
jgi:hypothetical protein